MSVRKELAELRLPEVLPGGAADFETRRREIVDILAREEYGYLPDVPYTMEIREEPGERLFGGGTAELWKTILTVGMNGGSHSFPLYCMVPVKNRPCPAVLLVNFRPGIPDSYLPAEELADNGFAVFSLCYNDVTKDNGDFDDGLAGLFYGGRPRAGADPGKISLWAWAASRALDYILTLPGVDPRNVAAAGHSRLGKTALWAAANDLRFTAVFANESGCSGGSLARGMDADAEHVVQICRTFPYWLCENYLKYAGHEDDMPFDQHFLLAAIAPRRLYIGLGEGDYWTGPRSQYRACFAAAPVYEALGAVPAFTGQDQYPVSGDRFHDGFIGFHMRSGDHFLSRRDWLAFMDYWSRWLNR